MLTHYLFDSFGLAIIALTIIVNIVMYPLTMKQLKATQAMQAVQPKLAELQKKYAKDRSRLAQEQMKLYKESGMSPAGCVVPMLVQMPIWIALYQSVMLVLAVAPEGLLNLSRYLYPIWPVVYSMLPLSKGFLWMNLAEPYFVLAILVGVTMWVQQKMVTPATTDSKQQAQTRMMLWMMPLMFGFLCLNFPSGLALYWVTSSIIRIIIQYYVTGWGGLVSTTDKGTGKGRVARDKSYKKRIAQVEEAPSGRDVITADIADIDEPSSVREEGLDYGKSGSKWQDSGGGGSARPGTVRGQPRRDRGNRPKRR